VNLEKFGRHGHSQNPKTFENVEESQGIRRKPESFNSGRIRKIPPDVPFPQLAAGGSRCLR
jgi:hypothetical protein